jgi:hypothetical protein
MAIKWGSTVVTTVKWGSTTCTTVYWGSTKVFPDEKTIYNGTNASSIFNEKSWAHQYGTNPSGYDTGDVLLKSSLVQFNSTNITMYGNGGLSDNNDVSYVLRAACITKSKIDLSIYKKVEIDISGTVHGKTTPNGITAQFVICASSNLNYTTYSDSYGTWISNYDNQDIYTQERYSAYRGSDATFSSGTYSFSKNISGSYYLVLEYRYPKDNIPSTYKFTINKIILKT